MRSRHLLAVVAVLVAMTLALAACGGEKDEGKDGDADGGSTASPLATCSGPAVAKTGLPADFPVPSGVTFTKTGTAGPSVIVEGFASGDVANVYNAWKAAFATAMYTLATSPAPMGRRPVRWRCATTAAATARSPSTWSTGQSRPVVQASAAVAVPSRGSS
jgi:hypothetical protein